MSDEPLPPLRFFLPDIKPESTKVSCLIEVEIETKHYPISPHKIRTKGVRYLGELNPVLANSVDADLEMRVSCNGELTRNSTEFEGDLERMEHERLVALNYIEKHLAEELKRVTASLCEEANLFISSPAEREKLIKQKLTREERAIRQRLRRAPNRMSQGEAAVFLNQALQIIKELIKAQLEVNRTNLAKKLYPENSNPLQELRRQVERAGFYNPTRENTFDYFLYTLEDMCHRLLVNKKAP